jgi:hypothetical protein
MPWSIYLSGASASESACRCRGKCCSQAGFAIHENDESGQRDISDQNIARLTDNIAELDGLIAEYEAKRG